MSVRWAGYGLNEAELRRRRLLNRLQTLLLVATMGCLLGTVGYVIGGWSYALLSVLAMALLYIFNPALSPRMVMSIFRGYPLRYAQAAPLYAALEELSLRAGLPAVPVLYYLPTPMMNAFAVGRPDSAAIALSDGLLRAMRPREIAAVLAHEVGHIAHNDLRTMSFADLTHRLTLFLSVFGQILLLVNLPLILWTDHHISWIAIILLVISPTLSALLQLALSRSREYEADLLAAELVGDPSALASALEVMERYQGGFIEQVLFPNRNRREPSLLRTHPPTAERIRRLRELQARRPDGYWPRLASHDPFTVPWERPEARLRAWRWFGSPR